MSKRQRHFLQTHFGNLHYWMQGQGQPLLLIHQSTQSVDEYDAFADALAGELTLIGIDLPGHGCSDDPDHELTMDEYAAATSTLIEALPFDRTDVLGHHGGGMVAVALAANSPQQVRRLVTSGAGIPSETIRHRILNEPMSRDLPLDEDGHFLQQTWSIYRDMAAPGSSPDTWFKPFSTGLRARSRRYDMHRQTMLFDYPAALRKVKQPTLILRGEFDHLAGDIELTANLVADSQLAEVSGVGAWMYSENPSAVAELVGAFVRAE